MLGKPASHGVAGLVVGNRAPFIFALRKLALDTTDDALSCHFKISDLYTVSIATCSDDGTFVDNIHNVSTREARSQSRQLSGVVLLCELRVDLNFL